MAANLKRLGTVISEARKKAGLSQAAAARRAGISPAYLNAIESAKTTGTGKASVPKVPTLRMIAEVVGLKRSDLLVLAGWDEDALYDQVIERKAEATAASAPEAENLLAVLHRAVELATAGEGQAQDEKPAPPPRGGDRPPRQPPSGTPRTRRAGNRGTG